MIDTRFLDVIPAIGATLSRPTRRAVVAGACGAAALAATGAAVSRPAADAAAPTFRKLRRVILFSFIPEFLSFESPPGL